MKVFETLRNYICYCGIEKDEYNALKKKDAYVSNYNVWRVLHFLMAAVFGALFAGSFFSHLMGTNRVLYLAFFLYSAVALFCFFRLRKDSLAAQLLIYLSISMLFLFGAFVTRNNPEIPATTFIVLLLITPMFMIDKPYFMAIELVAASVVFLVWMRGVKPYAVWRIDLVNVVIFTIVGIVLHVVANSLRIREFVLTRKINLQKDTDEMTGLRNKGSLTREIDAYLENASTDKGILFLMDVDKFKSINDTYGHDVGDEVIGRLGAFLGSRFTGDEIVGRFGGDEFVVFLRGTDDPEPACRIADGIVRGIRESVVLPDPSRRVSLSIGIAVYHGQEKHYSELFKKADIALYRAKADPENRYAVYKPEESPEAGESSGT